MMKSLIVTGGHLPTSFLLEQVEIAHPDMIVCADSGADPLFDAGILPDVLLGDFDSIQSTVFDHYVNKGIKIVRFSSQKDLTDTHIAVKYAINQGATDITILGGTGNRLDHTLSNIMLLECFSKKSKCRIIDLNNCIELMTEGSKKIDSNALYRYISLVPISKKVVGVTTEGLKYPLYNATLHRSDSYGVSNEILNGSGIITIKKGLLAVIQARD